MPDLVMLARLSQAPSRARAFPLAAWQPRPAGSVCYETGCSSVGRIASYTASQCFEISAMARDAVRAADSRASVHLLNLVDASR